ncbi:hypothetical protein MRB53_001918 [Persea americana]|uniref:Uncharacterized protein n=1 Tax=Persea americana TaxID=3435 RepID=A0ACC2MT30_PERAE|nr:hypothetical protein MRB53_001918 [Persea americana]
MRILVTSLLEKTRDVTDAGSPLPRYSPHRRRRWAWFGWDCSSEKEGKVTKLSPPSNRSLEAQVTLAVTR